MTIPSVVIDSSVIVKWLSQDNENHLEQADKILGDAQAEKIILIAPELAKYEVGNVLLLGKKLSPRQTKIVLEELYSLPISFIIQSKELAMRTFELAFKLGITYYDASFMSLAYEYDSILITENIKHQGKSNEIKVKSLVDY